MEIFLNDYILKQFEDYLIDTEESDNTIKQYKYCLKSYIQIAGEKLNKIKLKEYKEELIKTKSAKTVNVRIAGIIKFIKFYSKYENNKQFEDIIIKNIKLQNKTYLNNVISLDEFKKMYEYTKNTKNYKYYFILKFLGYTGARISELIKFTTSELKKGYFDSYSKGGKLRRIYIPKELQLEALNWIKEYKIDGYLFKNKFGEQITARGISGELKKIAKKLNIELKKVYPHSFRHMFAINFLKNNKDITLLADILGHSQLDTTRIYLRRTEEEQKQIINLINW